jgi:hypothetical protein
VRKTSCSIHVLGGIIALVKIYLPQSGFVQRLLASTILQHAWLDGVDAYSGLGARSL